MKVFNNVFFLSLFIYLITFNEKEVLDFSTQGNSFYISDNEIYELIFKIEEVKNLSKNKNFQTNKFSKTVLIIKKPDKKDAFYWVEVGHNYNKIYIVDYTFLLKKNKGKIVLYIYDVKKDKIIELNEWRKNNK